MTVKTILDKKGRDIFTMSPDATLGEVAAELTARRVGAVMIMQGQHLAGILSERDVVRAIATRGAEALSVAASSVMTQAVQTCTLEDFIEDVMEKMTNSRFRHMPVVEDGRVVGIISIGDVVKQRIEEAVRERDDMRAYIHSA